MVGFVVARERESILRAAAIAEQPHLAFLALLGEFVTLIVAELAHLRRRDEVDHWRFMNVAEFVTRLDEMVACVQIAIMFEGRPVSASGGVDAKKVAPKVRLERHIEQLDENPSDIASHPLLEYIDEEPAILMTADRAVGDQVPRLRIEQTLSTPGPLPPTLVRDGDRIGRRALDDGDKLHPFRAELVAEESINPPAMGLVGGVYGAQYVEFDFVRAQEAQALHDEVKCALAAPILPICVM